MPYVPTAQIPEQPDPVGFEPRLALDGGADGLVLYRRLLDGAAPLLGAGGALFLEAAPEYDRAPCRPRQAAFPAAGVEVLADYAGLDRLVAIYP